MKPRIAFHTIALVAAVVAAGAGCNDPLPTYEEPKVTIATIVPSATLDTVFYAETGDLIGPDSVLELDAPNPIIFSFFEENQYQETLYGPASISGKFELWAVDKPDVRATLPITESNMVPGTAYDSKTGILAMDPNYLLPFRVTWDLRDSKGKRFYRSFKKYQIVPYYGIFGYAFWRVSSIRIHVRVTIQLYAQSSAFIGDQEFDLNVRGGIVYFK